jgi:cytochrome c oxidase subunit 3
VSHAAHDHPPHLQHHFDTPTQQYDSGKLGMWLFLATEILLFGGLFCAYAVYRANHPEIFAYAHKFLDAKLGGTNTVILLTSSLTMAWGVRAAQLGQRKLLVWLLGLTLLGGAGFMGIKYVEYKSKWEHGLLWGVNYNPSEHGEEHGDEEHGVAAAEGAEAHADESHEATVAETGAPAAEEGAPAPTAGVLEVTESGLKIEQTSLPQAGTAPGGVVRDTGLEDAGHDPGDEPRNVQIFFGIYFLMTGLHGFHVLVGMLLIGWIMVRSYQGAFGPAYFTPVDLVGLYWHLVDLIWIFLFPLLYLIS